MRLADQFHETISATRTPAGLDELARKLWLAHGEGLIDDADAEALSAAVEARPGPPSPAKARQRAP
jgi:hypothetical protein